MKNIYATINIALLAGFFLVGCYTLIEHPKLEFTDSSGNTEKRKIKFFDDCLSCHTKEELKGTNFESYGYFDKAVEESKNYEDINKDSIENEDRANYNSYNSLNNSRRNVYYGFEQQPWWIVLPRPVSITIFGEEFNFSDKNNRNDMRGTEGERNISSPNSTITPESGRRLRNDSSSSSGNATESKESDSRKRKSDDEGKSSSNRSGERTK